MCHDCEAGDVFDTTMPQELLYATTVKQEPSYAHDCEAISVVATTTKQELLCARTVKQVPFHATTVELELFSPRL